MPISEIKEVADVPLAWLLISGGVALLAAVLTVRTASELPTARETFTRLLVIGIAAALGGYLGFTIDTTLMFIGVLVGIGFVEVSHRMLGPLLSKMGTVWDAIIAKFFK
jgi:hypothetical protein